MSLAEYLQRLRALGIELRVRDGRLVSDAPKGVLTAALRDEIGRRKEEILAFLGRGHDEGTAALDGPPLTAMARGGSIPLTASQQRLWLVDRMHADRSAAFNVPSAVRIRGRLDVAVLERGLTELVRRHEVLRTTFPASDGIPAQLIRPESAVSLPVVELLDIPPDRREVEAAIAVEAMARRAFKIDEEPPLRALLIRVADEDHLLVLVLHPIACDEWSLDIVWRELGACYDSLTAGDAPVLPALTIQCADFAIWQREWLEAGHGREQLDYWRRQLGTSVIPFELDADRSILPGIATCAGFRRIALDAGLSQTISALARAEGVTLFITLVAAFQALLCRYTAREDVLVGTSVSPRERPALQDLVGNFANTVVLRTDLSMDPGFLEILRRTRQTVLDAFGRLDVPYEKLVESLAPPRGIAGRPFFTCLFGMLAERSRPVALRGLDVSVWDVEPSPVEDGLSVYAQSGLAGLNLTCYYNAALYRESTIDLLLERFRTVLQSVAKDPTVRLWELPLEREGGELGSGHPRAAFRVLPVRGSYRSPSGEERTADGVSARAGASRSGRALSRKRSQAFANDDLELVLTAWWQEMIGVHRISLQDDFFALGGNSLLAARLFARIERALGYAVPLAFLYQASTIGKLAELLRRADRRSVWSPLVPIRTVGSRPPLFLVHGAEGNVLLYRELVQHLGDDQPAYGLQSEGLDPTRQFTPRIEEMAASYVAAIRSVQPQGPYILGGYCLGGTIALEIAQQLQVAGHRVGLVAMFETYNLRSSRLLKRFYHPLVHWAQNIVFHIRNALSLQPRERRLFFGRKLRVELGRLHVSLADAAAPIINQSGRSAGAYHHLRVKRANDAAQEAYVPKPYTGRLAVFTPKHYFLGYHDRAMGWRGLAMGVMHLHELPVAPHGMLVEPFVRKLADQLTMCIDGALLEHDERKLPGSP